MRAFGIPLWAIVLVACVIAPYLIRAWVDADRRRAHARTVALLRTIDPSFELGAARAEQPLEAASKETERGRGSR